MKARKSKAKDEFDHTFRAIYDRDVKWESDDVRGLLKLPPGVKVKVLNYDPVMKRVDIKLRFPAGYVEPAHTHKSWHSILVTKGRMCVAGKDLRQKMITLGFEPDATKSPAEVAQFIRGERQKWARLVKERNIKAE